MLSVAGEGAGQLADRFLVPSFWISPKLRAISNSMRWCGGAWRGGSSPTPS
jgi:hypothetical protein